MKVHHVGYAVADIRRAITAFEKIGYQPGEIVADCARRVRIAFVRNGHECVELIAPDGAGSPVDGVLKKMGASAYHICYETSDLDGAIRDMTEADDWMLIAEAQPAPAIGGRRVAFLYHRDVGTIELVETEA